jgi:hypothetical protein
MKHVAVQSNPMFSHLVVADGAVCGQTARVWATKRTRIRAGGLSTAGDATRA